MIHEETRFKLTSVCVPLKLEYGGPPKAILSLHNELRKSGIEQKILVLGKLKKSLLLSDSKGYSSALKEIESEHISKFTQNIYGIVFPSAFLRGLKLLQKTDVVIVHQIYTLSLLLGFAAKIRYNTNFYVMPHGSLNGYHEKHHKIRKVIARKLFLNRALDASSGILVATEAEKEQIPRKWEEKVSVVGLGIDTPGKDVQLSRSLRHKIISIGRITEKKNLMSLIDAFSKYREIHRSATLNIAGGGDKTLISALKRRVEEKDLMDSVFFPGWLNGQSKVEFFSEADVFVLPSFDENFAIAVGEALSYGIPCVLTSNVALSELVERRDAGVVIVDGDVDNIVNGMLKVANSNYEQLRENASLAFLEELSWSTVIKKWITYFQSKITK